MEYLLKSSALIILFYSFYKIVLEKETFFQHNRFFLIIGIISSLLIPLLVIPIYIEPTPIDLSSISVTEQSSSMTTLQSYNWNILLNIIYVSGIIFLLGKLLINLYSLVNLIVSSHKIKKSKFTFAITSKDTTPFSFFNFIVYNPTKFKDNELKQIITHEKIHAKEVHSIDIILAQLLTTIFWFNPIVWLYKKEITQNLEFIADEKAQEKLECEESYQKLILKTCLPKNQLAMTNNFYNSLIKKRIIMLHKNRSKSTNKWKYALMIPILVAFIMGFNTKTIAQNIVVEHDEEIITEDNKLVVISKDTKDSELKEIQNDLKKEGVTATFKNVKRNGDGEITRIAIDLKSKNSSANYNMHSDEAIKTIVISSSDNGKSLSIMNAGSKNHDNDYYFVSKDGEHKIHSKGKGNHFIVLDSDEDNISHTSDKDVFVIKSKDKNGKVKIIEIDDDEDNDVEWVTEKKNNSKVEIVRKKGKENVFISDFHNDAIVYINGKKSSKKQMDKLNPNDIERVNVLKGDSAEKKYGKKAREGVIEITTKEK